MVQYNCERCGKQFEHHGDYIKHLDRKVPCNGGENAPTLIELKERLQKLENMAQNGAIDNSNNTENTEKEEIFYGYSKQMAKEGSFRRSF